MLLIDPGTGGLSGQLRRVAEALGRCGGACSETLRSLAESATASERCIAYMATRFLPDLSVQQRYKQPFSTLSPAGAAGFDAEYEEAIR